MDHSLLVRRHQRVGECQRQVQHDLRPGRLGASQTSHRHPFDQLHGEEANTAGFLDGVEHDDVRVVQARDRPGFALEPGSTLGVAGEFGRQHFERDLTREARIARAIDLAHTARADRTTIS